MSGTSFAELYCQRNNLEPERYEKVLLAQSLYPHARWFYHVVKLMRPDHFAADLDLVRNVGTLHRFRDFTHDVQQFLHHPANCGVLRRTFNVRISTKRLRRLVRSTLRPGSGESKPEQDQTAAPFKPDATVVTQTNSKSRIDSGVPARSF